MNRIRNVVESFFEVGEQIVVGVSGGADSMTLLHCLLKSEKNFNLIVAHFNHCLRGKESDGDEEFVRNFCRENGIYFISRRKDIKKIAIEKKLSLEECGRIERYKFFESIGGRIALAHTLSDVVETFFFKYIKRLCFERFAFNSTKKGQYSSTFIRFFS